MPYPSVGWTAARVNAERWTREESPGSMDIRCRITSGGRKPRDSATENRPPLPSRPACGEGVVRVKRCGKSAPRLRQRRRHGKPHREQDRIGTAYGRKPGIDVRIFAVRVGCPRRRAIGVAEEWPPRKGFALALQNPAYRPADALRGS